MKTPLIFFISTICFLILTKSYSQCEITTLSVAPASACIGGQITVSFDNPNSCGYLIDLVDPANQTYQMVRENDPFTGTTYVGSIPQNITPASGYRVRVGDGDQLEYYSQPFTVSGTTVPNISVTRSTNRLCDGTATTFSASGASNYIWSTGETGSSIVVTPPLSSNNISLTAYYNNGCNATSGWSFQPSSTALPTLSVTPANVTVCPGEEVSLSASGSIGYPVNGRSNYIWSTGQTTQSITLQPNKTRVYTLEGMHPVSSCPGTAGFTIYVDPTIVIASTKDSVCLDSNTAVTLRASGAATYLWYDNSVADSIVVSPNATTTYSVQGTGANSCVNTSEKTIAVYDCSAPNNVGLNNRLYSEEKIKIYFNPVIDKSIRIETDYDIISVSIYSVFGKKTALLNSGTNQFTLNNFSELSPGIYFIAAETISNRALFKKILISN